MGSAIGALTAGLKNAFGFAVEKIQALINKPCCKKPDIQPRTWNGVTEDFCNNCGLYQKSPVRRTPRDRDAGRAGAAGGWELRWRLEYWWHGLADALWGALEWAVEKIQGPAPKDRPLQQEQDVPLASARHPRSLLRRFLDWLFDAPVEVDGVMYSRAAYNAWKAKGGTGSPWQDGMR